MIDYWLAVAHHLIVFAMVALVALEISLLKPPLDAARITRVARIDMIYGVLAVAIIVAGFLRANLAAKGWHYYSHNLFFWLKIGTFALIGPAALFRSADGAHVGTAEQRLGSLQPAAISFSSPADASAAARVIETGVGSLPLDPTLGQAHEIEATHETLWEHVQKGGPVMVPILGMAAAALLVALYKWLRLAASRLPQGSDRSRIIGALDVLAESMSDAELQEAIRRAKEWKPGPGSVNLPSAR